FPACQYGGEHPLGCHRGDGQYSSDGLLHRILSLVGAGAMLFSGWQSPASALPPYGTTARLTRRLTRRTGTAASPAGSVGRSARRRPSAPAAVRSPAPHRGSAPRTPARSPGWIAWCTRTG